MKTYAYAFPFKSIVAGWTAGFPIGLAPGPRDHLLTVIIACQSQEDSI